MEEQEAISNGFLKTFISESKILGEKRRCDDLDGRFGFSYKRLHLDSSPQSEITNLDSIATGNKESNEHSKFTLEDMSRRSEVSQVLNTDAKTSLTELDLNTDVCLAIDNNVVSQKGIGLGLGLDLNADAVSSSVNDDSPCGVKKRCKSLKSRDVVSECGSSSGVSEEKDPMKVWKEMKQNGFLSCPHGGISVASSCIVSSSHGGIPAPRKRGRKSKNDSMKKKMEIAKREEVDRFAKIAAPSGLLNGLNPGILNHVRNKKQVMSIIHSMIKSEKDSRSTHETGVKNSENGTYNGLNQSGFPQDAQLSSSFNQAFKSSALVGQCGIGESSFVHRIKLEDDSLSLKLSSLPNHESENFTSEGVLTVKAATIASQWLELLHQDIKGRLSALRRSKKRVKAVITTELPFLIHKEFSSAQENNPNVMMNDGFSKIATTETHKARWTQLFDQLDQTLSDEEKQLESWLNQVKELRTHCDQGLQHLNWNSNLNLLQFGVQETDLGARQAVSSEREIAVRAAAASIYSTCNSLLSKENITCS